MMSMKTLTENTFRSSFTPIQPKKNDVPLTPVEKWVLIKENNTSIMRKTFSFRDVLLRNRFVRDIMEHEAEISRFSKMIIDENTVNFSITTKNIDLVTELDKEFAKFADNVFRDVVS